ncbi:hypothetical protein [Lutibaculum baratangense]|nr:hypothetical protein [Lutibaculum baratangense]
MAELVRLPDRAQAERLVRAWLDRQSTTWAVYVEETGCTMLDPAEARALEDEDARELDDMLRVFGQTSRSRFREVLRRALTGREPRARAAIEPLVNDIMRQIAPDLAPDSQDGRLLGRTIVNGLATMFDEQEALELGEFLPVLAGSPTAQVEEPVPDASAEPFLQHWDSFATSKEEVGDWKPDTTSNARSSRNLFAGLVGPDCNASDISRATVSKFRSQLFALPRMYDKARKWRGLPHAKIIEVAKEEDARGGKKEEKAIERLSLPTVDKHTGNLLEYWRWCQTHGRIPKAWENPFVGFIKSKPKGRRARGLRDPWTEEMITILFQSPIWTGCKSLHRRSTPGPEIFRDAHFWLPLLGRATGAREDELCSRLVGDVRFTDDVPYLEIKDSKSDQSTRDLPLPKIILDLGFLEFRYWGRAADEPLFPELIPQGPGANRSAAFSGPFTDYRRKVGCYRPKMDFHSFRHNVITDLTNVPGLSEVWIDEITGHNNDFRDSERSRYSKGIYLRHLRWALNHVNFGVDLSHLNYEGPAGVPAPGAAQELRRYVARAEREMASKASRRGKNSQG